MVWNSHALGGHLLEAAVEDVLFHLEIGNAVAQQAADAVGLLEKRHPVARAIQLLRGGQARGPRANHGDALAGARFRRLRLDPAFLPGVIDDRLLDHLDRDRRLVDAQHAGRLAGRRADAPGELRKIIRGVQDANRILPLVVIDEVVPVGNDVVDRAAGVAERNAAIHAARRLRAHAFFRERLIDLEIIVDALRHGPARGSLAIVFLEPGDFTHRSPARESSCPPAPPARPPERAGFPERACIRAGTP